jgi:hypothetical protein
VVRRLWVLAPVVLVALLIGYMGMSVQGRIASFRSPVANGLIQSWNDNLFLEPLRDELFRLVADNPSVARQMRKALQPPIEGPSLIAGPEAFTLTFPQFANGQAAGLKIKSSVIVINNGGADASGTIFLYAQSGSPLTVPTNLGTGSQFPFELDAGEVFRIETTGNGGLAIGWVKVLSDIALSGSGTFTVFDGSGGFLSEVGIGDSSPAESFIIFVDTTEGKNSGFAVCNPGSSATANLTVELRQLNGTVTASSQETLPARNQKSEYVTETFNGKIPANFKGVVAVSSDQPVSLVTLKARGVNFTSLPGVPGVADGADAEDLLFARVGDGLFGTLKFQTSFIFLNNSPDPVTGQLTLYTEHGAPLALTIGGKKASTFGVEVPAGGAAELVTSGATNPGVVGWAKVESDLPLAGGAAFTILDNASGDFLSEVGVPASSETPRPEIYVRESADTSTGVAVTNPLDLPLKLRLQLVRGSAHVASEGNSEVDRLADSGLEIYEKTIDLPALSHVGRFIFELFGDVPAVKNKDFEGRLEMEAYTETYGRDIQAAITGITLLARQTKLTSLPMANHAINFGPRIDFRPATLLAGSRPDTCFDLRQLQNEVPMKKAIVTIEGVSLDTGGIQDVDRIGVFSSRILGALLIGNQFANEVQLDGLDFYAPVTFDGELEHDVFIGAVSSLQGGGIRFEIDANSTSNKLNQVSYGASICIAPEILQLSGSAGEVLSVNQEYESYEVNLGQNDTLMSHRRSLVQLEAPKAIRVDSVIPSRITGGDQVIVRGSGFSATAGQNRVTVQGTSRIEAQVVSAKTTELTVQLPKECRSGDLIVEQSGQSSNPYRMEVVFAPVIGVNLGAFSSGSQVPLNLTISQAAGEIGFWKVALRPAVGEWIVSGLSPETKIGDVQYAGTNYDLVVESTASGSFTAKVVKPGSSSVKLILEVTGGPGGDLILRTASSPISPSMVLGDQVTSLTTTVPLFQPGSNSGTSVTFNIEANSLPERINIVDTSRELGSNQTVRSN